MSKKKKPVVNHDRSSEERLATCREALTAIGLGDYLYLAGEHPWDFLEQRIICDPQGKAVVCTNDWGYHIVEAIGEVLGRKIEALALTTEGRKTCVLTSKERLSIPERHTIAAITRYFDTYRPGFRAGKDRVTLPEAFRPFAAPVNFLDEADAFELASAIRATFGGWDVDVTATDEGYAVIVQDERGDIEGWAAEHIAAVAAVVESFTLTPKQKRLVESSGEVDYFAEKWQNAVIGRYTLQHRLEKKLDTLLDRANGLEEKLSHLSVARAKPGAGKKRVAKSA